MKRSIPTTLLAVISISVGVYCYYELIIHPIIQAINRENVEPLTHAEPTGESLNLYLLILIPVSLIPIFMTSIFGCKLLKEVNKTNIKGAVGGLAIFGFIGILTFLNRSIFEPNGLYMKLLVTPQLIAGSLAFSIYVVLCKYVMKKEELMPDEKGEFIGRGILFLLALGLWISSSEILTLFVPVEPDRTSAPQFPWPLIAFIVPVVISMLFYKTGVRFFVKKREKVTTF